MMVLLVDYTPYDSFHDLLCALRFVSQHSSPQVSAAMCGIAGYSLLSSHRFDHEFLIAILIITYHNR